MKLDDFFSLEDEREIIRAFYSLKERRLIWEKMQERSAELRQLAKTAYKQQKSAGLRFRARADELDRQCRILDGFDPYRDETSWEAERLAVEQSTTEDRP